MKRKTKPIALEIIVLVTIVLVTIAIVFLFTAIVPLRPATTKEFTTDTTQKPMSDTTMTVEPQKVSNSSEPLKPSDSLTKLEQIQPSSEEILLEEEIKRQKQYELEVISKIVYVESRGEEFKGKVAVAATVINRLESPRFPNEIDEVKSGYASITRVEIDYNDDCWIECIDAAKQAIEGDDPLEEYIGSPTLYFYNPALSDPDEVEKRKDLTNTVTVGNHVFYGAQGEW